MPGHFKAPKKNLLDESNALSFVPDRRSAQADYYKLENRERQLAAIENLDPNELAYVLNNPARGAGAGTAEDVSASFPPLPPEGLSLVDLE